MFSASLFDVALAALAEEDEEEKEEVSEVVVFSGDVAVEEVLMTVEETLVDTLKGTFGCVDVVCDCLAALLALNCDN